MKKLLSSKKGFALSTVIHIAIAFVFVSELSSFAKRPKNQDSDTVVIEMLPSSTITNMKTQQLDGTKEKPEKLFKNNASTIQKNEKNKEQGVSELKNAKSKNLEIIPISQQKPKLNQYRDTKNIDIPSITTKPTPNKSQKTKNNSYEDLFGSLLKTSEEKNTHVTKKDTTKGNNEDGLVSSIPTIYDSNLLMTQNLVSYVKSQFAQCWIVPIKTSDIVDKSVTILIRLSPEGHVTYIAPTTSSYSNSQAHLVLLESAKRAIRNCSPITGLEKKYYHLWKEMELTFNTKTLI